MFSVGGLLAVIQAGAVLTMPPSPRFYVLHGKYSKVLRKNLLTVILAFSLSFRTLMHRLTKAASSGS